jgi:hypothetical protein
MRKKQMEQEKVLLKETALSIPVENEWALRLVVKKTFFTRSGIVRSSSWYLVKTIGGKEEFVLCSDEKAQLIIDYVIGKQSRIGGPYR